MTDAKDWLGKVGSSWAREWQRTDRSFLPVTERLLAEARSDDFSQVLDIGCGAGETSLALAHGHAEGHVLGIDISEDLLAVARMRGRDVPNLRFDLADAAQWEVTEAARPDLLVSRHGVMFFADPVAAFRNLAGQAKPKARLVFSCFRAPRENGWVSELLSALPRSDGPPPDPEAPGPFAFADRVRVDRILDTAGWDDIAFEPIDYGMVGGEGEDAVEDAVSYFLRIGPAARALTALGEEQRGAAVDRIRQVIERHCVQGTVSLPAACWLVTARAPA